MASTTSGAQTTARTGSSARAAQSTESPEPAAAAAPLDMLLNDAALGPVQRWNPGVAGLKAAGKLALRPGTTARRGVNLARELARIGLGRSEVGPAKSDRRFKDPAWSGNPAFRRLGQAYLAAAKTLDALLCEVELDWSEERRVRFATENVIDAIAPTNFPLTNPAVLKAA